MIKLRRFILERKIKILISIPFLVMKEKKIFLRAESPPYKVVLYSCPVARNIFTAYHSEMHFSV